MTRLPTTLRCSESLLARQHQPQPSLPLADTTRGAETLPPLMLPEPAAGHPVCLRTGYSSDMQFGQGVQTSPCSPPRFPCVASAKESFLGITGLARGIGRAQSSRRASPLSRRGPGTACAPNTCGSTEHPFPTHSCSASQHRKERSQQSSSHCGPTRSTSEA